MSIGMERVTAVRRSTWTILIWATVLCLLAIAFRYLVIEFRPVSSLCEVDLPPGWCAVREFVIELFYSDSVGIASLAAALLAFVLYNQRGSRFLACVATLIAAPAIVLYSADVAVPALLIGGLRMLRD
jgi:hypothetical protein